MASYPKGRIAVRGSLTYFAGHRAEISDHSGPRSKCRDIATMVCAAKDLSGPCVSWVKTRIAVQRPNVRFRRLRTCRIRLCARSADIVAKVPNCPAPIFLL
jgi:hypothetical protein